MSRARKKMDEQPTPDPDLEAVLRAANREWAEEAAEDERLTELLRRRRLGLSDLALAWVHRGQRVRVELGSQTYTGQVVVAGTDYALLERTEDEVAIRLDRATWTLEPDAGPGREQSGDPTSLKALLAEAAATAATVRLVTQEGKALVATVAVVAADHIEARQDHTTVMIPIEAIAVVISPRG